MAFLSCELYSQALRMPTTVSVILPQDATGRSDPPKTLYLLHGRSHDHSVWQRFTSLERYAQPYHAAIVMPEANRSFYTDMEYGVSYFTYLTRELPELCESMFRLGKERYAAGMSMGGYGCLKAVLSRPDFYAGCAAISAVTDIRKHVEETPEDDPKKREFRGIFGKALEISDRDDLYALARAIPPEKTPEICFLCGTEDHLYGEQRAFRDFLAARGCRTELEEWPGVHDWTFWDRAIEKVLARFFG